MFPFVAGKKISGRSHLPELRLGSGGGEGTRMLRMQNHHSPPLTTNRLFPPACLLYLAEPSTRASKSPSPTPRSLRCLSCKSAMMMLGRSCTSEHSKTLSKDFSRRNQDSLRLSKSQICPRQHRDVLVASLGYAVANRHAGFGKFVRNSQIFGC